jgi:hypothetical protein
MKKIIVLVFGFGFCYATEPEVTTTTQVKEQIQRIEVPSHIKGLHIVNNNTLRWSDTKPSYVPEEYYAARDAYPQYPLEEKHRARWQRTLVAVVCAVGVYGVVRAYVYLLTQELDNKAHWWNWKSELSLSAISPESEKQLAQELLTQIQQRYDKKTAHDVAFIMPLVHFINDTNHEQKYLEHLIKVYEGLCSYHMHYALAADEQMIGKARVKLARLAYIRRLCMKWLSGYAADVPTAV